MVNWKRVLQYTKYVASTIVTLFCFFMIVYGIGSQLTKLAGPWYVHFILLILMVVLLGYLEGLQVAIVELATHSDATWFKDTHPRGYATFQLSTKGPNVKRFLVGRQVFVIMVVFILAQLTTYPDMATMPFSDSPIPGWFHILVLETGLPGALVVVAFGQLAPQLVATSYPVEFMNIRGSYAVVKIALTLESLGITHFSWVLTGIMRRMCGFQKRARESDPEDDDAASHHGSESGDAENAQLVGGLDHLHELEADLDLFDSEYDPQRSDFAQGPVGGVTPNPLTYPAPYKVAAFLKKRGHIVPRFLLPPYHPRHIPPHSVAYTLLRKQQRLEEDNSRITKQLAHATASLAVLQRFVSALKAGDQKRLPVLLESVSEEMEGLSQTEQEAAAARYPVVEGEFARMLPSLASVLITHGAHMKKSPSAPSFSGVGDTGPELDIGPAVSSTRDDFDLDISISGTHAVSTLDIDVANLGVGARARK